jgi:predicted O-methyltransferase YrrM
MTRSLLPRRGTRHTDVRVSSSFDRGDGGVDYYEGVLVGAEAIGRLAASAEAQAGVQEVLDGLEDPGDDYLPYVREFTRRAREQAGSVAAWADITTALWAATRLVEPRDYLEIGVRRGRSMAVVGAGAPDASITGIDLWVEGYAGMDNPGPDHVRSHIRAVGHRGELELLSGSSHDLLPRLPSDRSFDLITVDGDHTPRGAAKDLRDVLPRLRIGGVLVFDDMRHPAHPRLHDVWRRVVGSQRRYSTWHFDDIGFGVAVAVRRW